MNKIDIWANIDRCQLYFMINVRSTTRYNHIKMSMYIVTTLNGTFEKNADKLRIALFSKF